MKLKPVHSLPTQNKVINNTKFLTIHLDRSVWNLSTCPKDILSCPRQPLMLISSGIHIKKRKSWLKS